MTYEERQLHRELGEALEELRQDLSTGDPSEPLTRAEALRMVELIDAALERVSPERWDHYLTVIADEVTRRVGSFPTPL